MTTIEKDATPMLGARVGSAKISSTFAAQVAALPSRQTVRAVVLLSVDLKAMPDSSVERAKRVEWIRCGTEEHLPELDRILARFGGRRMAQHPNASGAIAVEIPAQGIKALAGSKAVRSILEDQVMVSAGAAHTAQY